MLSCFIKQKVLLFFLSGNQQPFARRYVNFSFPFGDVFTNLFFLPKLRVMFRTGISVGDLL